tara:strand:- start:75 stop:245 length:171 start_codon:yes stop_codon:yes gene_type:complete
MTGHAHLSIQKTKKYKKYAGVAYKYGYTPGGPSNPILAQKLGEMVAGQIHQFCNKH